MKRPGFSLSTILLVVILLGAVAWVGSLVNPIKHSEGDGHDHGNEQQNVKKEPDAKPDDAASNSSKTRKDIEKNEAEQRRRMMQELVKRNNSEGNKTGVPASPMKDPEAIDPTANHFFQQDMGQEGIAKQQAEIAIKKKAFDAEMAKNRRSPFGKAVLLHEGETPKGNTAGSQKSHEEKGHEGHNH